MNREQAVALAVEWAKKYPQSYVTGENFMPHEWVIQAVMAASKFEELGDSRARFEELMSHSPYERSVERFPEDPEVTAWPGSYKDINVDMAWQFWCMALAGNTGPKVVISLDLINRLLTNGRDLVRIIQEYDNDFPHAQKEGDDETATAFNLALAELKGRL